MILKIDVQGAQKVKEQVSEALLIFVIPPSLETLFARLRARATETADELEVRQRDAAIELARQDDYDHVVVNETGQVARTADQIEAIIATRTGGTRGPAGPRLGRRDPRAGARALEHGAAPATRPRRRPALVEVAVDAAGAGGARPYTYAVPDEPRGPQGWRGGAGRVRPATGARRSCWVRRRRRRPAARLSSRSPTGSAPTGRCCPD